jgi:hypothetical protein
MQGIPSNSTLLRSPLTLVAIAGWALLMCNPCHGEQGISEFITGN